jgi:hypothetical protein
MRVPLAILASVIPIVVAIVSIALSTWAAGGPCPPEPFGC